MLIKYEDLQDKKFEIFFNVVKFINSLVNKDEKVNEDKLENSIINGQKISFFNLGFNNRWKKNLPQNFQTIMSDHFKEDLKFLKY